MDGDAVGPVTHYIHLNPVRAVVTAEKLESYETSSFHQLWYKRKRWSFSDFEGCLNSAGGLEDSPKGKRLYRDYLA